MQIDDILESEQFKELNLFLTEEMNKYAGKEIIEKMLNLFEEMPLVRDWFYSPSSSLNGRRPYDYCREGRILEVSNVVGRISAGTF